LIPIIIVIIVVVIVLALVLPAIFLFSSDEGSSSGGYTGEEVVERAKITIRNPTERSYAFQLEIVTVSGVSLNLEDATFQVFDEDGILRWKLYTYSASPAGFTIGASKIYAIPSNNADHVTDFTTGSTIDSASTFEHYQNCSMVYLDSDADGKLTAGDQIYIYKDYNSDGFDDVSYDYEFEIRDGDNLVSSKVF
jgi:hypothetical protein